MFKIPVVKPILVSLLCMLGGLGAAEPLQVQDGRVLSIKTSSGQTCGLVIKEVSEGDELGRILIFTPLGGHPNNPSLIRPLRRFLPVYGYESVVVALPTDEAIAKSCVQAAIAWHQKSPLSLGVVAIGTSASLIQANLNVLPAKANKICLISSVVKPGKTVLFAKQSVLDVVAEFDYAPVLSAAKARRNAPKDVSTQGYQPLMIRGAGHDFYPMEETLAANITGFFKS